MLDEEIGAALGRTRQSVLLRRVRTLHLRKLRPQPYWSQEDDALLKAVYGRVDAHYLAAFLNRTKGAIRARAFDLGIKGLRGAWSEEEDDIIREHFPRRSVTSFSNMLPERTVYAIYARATKLDVQRDSAALFQTWSQRFYAYPPELQSLINLHNTVKRKLRDVEAKY